MLRFLLLIMAQAAIKEWTSKSHFTTWGGLETRLTNGRTQPWPKRAQRRLEGEHGEHILTRLIAIERQLGLRDRVEIPRYSRRRPLGRD
jgi:hypothetical protein